MFKLNLFYIDIATAANTDFMYLYLFPNIF